MGAIPLKDEPQERTLPYRSEIVELSLNKVEQNIYDAVIGLTLMQDNPTIKGSGTRFGVDAITEKVYPEVVQQKLVEAEHGRQLFISSLQSQKKRAEGFWTGEIPDSVKNSLASQFAAAPGEIMTMGVYLIPYAGVPIGAAMTAGRYYNEGYTEAKDNGFQEQDAHNIATGYTAIFGTIGFTIDKFTAGIGRMGRFKSLRQALTDQKLIIAGASTAAANEAITETAESAYLQNQTTGEIDWRRARTEGTVAAFTGLLGGETFGQINVAQKNKIEKSLIEKGIDSDTAKAIMSANTEEEARAIYKKWLDRYIAQHGERVNRVLNPEESFEVDPASKPMTKGDFRLFGRDENGNVLDNQAIIERAKEAIEPELQGIFIQAAINPTDENVKMYNKAAEAFILQEDTVSRQEEVDEETDTDIEPIDEVAPEPLTEVEVETKPELPSPAPDLMPSVVPEEIKEIDRQIKELEEQAEQTSYPESDRIKTQIKDLGNTRKRLRFEGVINDPNSSPEEKNLAYLNLMGLPTDVIKTKMKLNDIDLDSQEYIELQIEQIKSQIETLKRFYEFNPNAKYFDQISYEKRRNTLLKRFSQLQEDQADLGVEVTPEAEIVAEAYSRTCSRA